ncbi:MAG TPA: carboxypeptidase-like regulatory domain-containing protein, partial [Terriglobia bacterium]|nr:carboxypeptidase-like regulatory domain-containing protein [Terriglobia bacterium]
MVTTTSWAAASPVLMGRVTDSRGKPIPDARVRLQTDDGKTTEVVTDGHGSYRLEVNGRFRLEIRHDAYRTVR